MRPSDPDPFFWIELPGTTNNLGKFQKFILDHAKGHQIQVDITGKVELVLEEVLLNIMNHAYSGGQQGTIKAGCVFSDEGKFIVRIIDQGSPFDPSSIPEPDTTLSVEERNIGGLGIFLVRKLSDHVLYKRVDGQNILDIGFKI